MDAPTRIFISYRRDDASGYAGRLEESLERRLGAGSVFRDLEDIPPGADFAAVIRGQLAGAQAVVILIGPHWAGGDSIGSRRIDDPGDFVRIEAQEALASSARVVPVLLPGTTMPAEAELPEPLRALTRRNAMSISDVHWDADVDRLVAAFGLLRRRRVWPWAIAAALAAALATAAVCRWTGGGEDASGEQLLGRWEASVKYSWGDRHEERFEFLRHAGGIAGTASYLRYPRAIENLRWDGRNLHFETRSETIAGDETRENRHAYAAELRDDGGADVLVFRLQSTGGFGSEPPITSAARRAAPAASAAAQR